MVAYSAVCHGGAWSFTNCGRLAYAQRLEVTPRSASVEQAVHYSNILGDVCLLLLCKGTRTPKRGEFNSFTIRQRSIDYEVISERTELKERIFFIDIEHAFGPRGPGDVPTSWQIAGLSSETSVFGSQVPESVSRLLAIPPDDRQWKCLLEPYILAKISIWAAAREECEEIEEAYLAACSEDMKTIPIPSWKEVYGQEINKKRKADSSKSVAADRVTVKNGLDDDGSSGGDEVHEASTGASSSLASDVSDGMVKLALSSDASLYDDSHVFGGEVDKLLLPKDSYIFVGLPTKDVASYCISEGLKGVSAAVYLKKVISDLEKKSHALKLVNQQLREENKKLRASDIASRNRLSTLEAELGEARSSVDVLRADYDG